MKLFFPSAAILCLAMAGCVDPVTAPAEFTCKANQSWQNTGLLLHSGDRMTVEYENGQWTTDRRIGLAPPAGNPNTPGRPGDVLPQANRSALIGRIADSVFLIGNGYDGVIQTEGRLYCVMNANISTSDGFQFLPAEGAVTMRAWIVRAHPVCDPATSICL